MKLNEITIEITQQCTNRCVYCSSHSDIEKLEALDFDAICEVVDDAIALGSTSISLSGGEPFLREDVVKIVDYINSKGIKPRLYSGGIYCSKGHYSSVPTSLLEGVKNKLSALIFNYETVDAVLYATIMGTEPANLTVLDDTITSAITLNIPVEAHLVPMHCNYRQIPDVLDKLYSMGVTNVSFLRLVAQGRVPDNRDIVELNNVEQQELIQILDACKHRYADKIRLGLPFSAKRAACGTGTVKLTVRYDGFVFPCEAFKDGMMELLQGIKADNVKNMRLIDIYEQSAYLQEVRDGLQVFSDSDCNEKCYGQYLRQE